MQVKAASVHLCLSEAQFIHSDHDLSLKPQSFCCRCNRIMKPSFLSCVHIAVIVCVCQCVNEADLVFRQGKFIYIAQFIHSGNSKCFT